jgi:leucyl-tRNA synthetase
MLGFDEPWIVLRNQGQVLGADHQRMSKSRGNVANPDELVARYGSDTVRLFLMFIGPWDQGGPWNPMGIEGIHRFLGRVWHLAQLEAAAHDAAPVEEMEQALRRATHATIAGVSDDIDGFRFNTAVAKLVELSNAIGRARDDGIGDSAAYAEAVDSLLLLLAPAAPHIAEELWERRGHDYSIHTEVWPTADPALTLSDTLELPVQVNGKLRDRLVVTRDTPSDEIERLALASEHVQRYLQGRLPRRVIQVPGKLVNVVTPADG